MSGNPIENSQGYVELCCFLLEKLEVNSLKFYRINK